MTSGSDVEPDTPALRAVAAAGVDHEVVVTERARSVEESARLQGIDPGQLVRSLLVRRDEDDYVFVLIPGGRRIDWPKLRAHLGVNRASLPDLDQVRTATGYERGAVTPFGSARPWPVVVDESAVEQERVALGGGAHGVNLHLGPADLVAALDAAVADVSEPEA